MPKILLGNCYDEQSFSILQECIPEGYDLSQLPHPSQEELVEAVEDADYLIASGRLRIDKTVITHASRLKMVARTGVGLDSIDLKALEEAGISLRVNEGVNSTSVAEHTMLLILAALRRLPEVDRLVKKGEWPKRVLGVKTHELAGKRVFVAGLGSIGGKVSQLLNAFGCHVFGSDHVERGCLPDDFYSADIVTLHCPLLPETKHLIDSSTVELMKPGCIVVNTARGGLIDEYALAKGLKCGQIGFACLDVRGCEPSKDPSPFDGLDNVILTSHIAGITYESFRAMLEGAVTNIVEFEKASAR